jgi:hypothetical protein
VALAGDDCCELVVRRRDARLRDLVVELRLQILERGEADLQPCVGAPGAEAVAADADPAGDVTGLDARG